MNDRSALDEALTGAGQERMRAEIAQFVGSATWRYSPGDHPPLGLVKWARGAARLTQRDAAALVYRAAPSRWAEWEAGTYRMDPAVFELFCRKTGLWDAVVAGED